MEPVSAVDGSYVAEIQEWRQERFDELKGSTGWLSLVGLYWLEEGENTFGADPANDIVFPAGMGSAFMGSFFLVDGAVRVQVNPDVPVLNGEKAVVAPLDLKNDQTGKPTVLTLGSLSWFIIERGGRFGVRLRDSDSEILRDFKGVAQFLVDPAWRIAAKFEVHKTPKTLRIPTVLGTELKMPSKGTLVFHVGGEVYRLEATAVEDTVEEMVYVIFGDESNGSDTYGGGRYLYVKKSSDSEDYIIDFNKAYNPPCAFTEFATCPLPSVENRLPLRITAGEKKYHDTGH